MYEIIKNPITTWLKWLLKKYFYEFKYRKNQLKIQYLAKFSECRFGRYNTLYERAQLTQIHLGDYSYVGANNRLARVSIGKFCCLGPDVIAGLGRHPVSSHASIHPIFYSPNAQAGITFADKSYFKETDEINIGNDVWIGARAIILDGVSIGDGAIVASGAVVTTNIPPYAIVGGVPAKLIKYRFQPAQIKTLLAIKWWDREESWLRKNFQKFHHAESLIDFIREKELT